MCEYCALLRHVLTKSPINDCPACASPHSDSGRPSICVSCVVFCVNSSTHICRTIESQQPQLHPSLNNPHPGFTVSPTHQYDASSLSLEKPKPDSTSPVLRNPFNLELLSHIQQAVQQVLASNTSSNLCTTVHISHPVLPLTMKNLHSLHDRTPLTILHQFHHLHITSALPLIPRDRTMHVTANQITYPLTPPRASHTATPHHLQLFINPYNCHPYLIHTHRLTEQTTRPLELTTTLPSTASIPGRPQRRPMMRTQSHAPNRITTLTFPTASTQHQLSIMTLVTHMLLYDPIITARQSWNIVRDKETHQHTLQLILTTTNFQSYHKVWFSVQDPPVSLSSTQTPDHTTTNLIIPSLPP